MNKNFNSHAHVERDVLSGLGPYEEDEISTHTLTWSVTSGIAQAMAEQWGFQLTRSRGA